ncbi:MAG: aldo/keto reductase [Thermoguttaceae bacterium]
MIYRKLGSSNIEVSTVAFGAWAIGGWMWGGTDEREAVDAIHAALDHGITLIDTAPIYGFGHSEELVGRALHDRREKAVVATKCGMVWDRQEGEFFFHSSLEGMTFRESEKKIYKCLRPDSIRAELEQSLKRLGMTHVDLYQTHWQEGTTPIADTMATLLKLKDEGKIRAIGVCNANLIQLAEYGAIDTDQEKFSLLDRDIERDGRLAYCRRSGIGMLPYSPLSNGLLTGTIRPDRQFGSGDLRRGNRRFTAANIEKVNGMLEQLRPIAEQHHVSTAQLVIAWTVSQPGVTSVLCGARNARQAIENAAAGNLALSAEELDTIGATVHV